MVYTYLCSNNKCNYQFEIFQTLSSYEVLKVCPKCNKTSLARNYQADLPTTNIRLGDDQLTVGHLAHRHSEEFSDDKKESLHIKNHAYMENPPSYQKTKKMAESRASRRKNNPKISRRKNGQN